MQRPHSFNKYLLNTDSVPGPELAVGYWTKIPAYILVKEAVKESISVVEIKESNSLYTG